MVQYAWLLFGGMSRAAAAGVVRRAKVGVWRSAGMRGRCLAIATLVLITLSAAQSLWAGSFTEVPGGHWAYAACARLAEMGLLPERPSAFSGKPQLTRFEFGITVLDPLADIDRAVSALPADADPRTVLNATARALKLSPRSSETDIARAAADLRRLGIEFADVLRALNLDPARAVRALEAVAVGDVRAWRTEALALPLRGLSLTRGRSAGDSFRVPVGHGTVALSYDRDLRAPEMLDYLATVAAERGAKAGGVAAAGPALRDPQVSRVRTAYEYGLGPALTLSLAYEEIARSGQGLEPVDSASLASLGIGYKITRTASVTLSYSLLEYSNHLFDSPPLRDRVAETAVSIGF